MHNEDCFFIGIAATAGKRELAFAAIDRELRPAQVGSGDMESVTGYVSGHKNSLVAIAGPRQPNQGLMKRDDVRANLNPVPRSGQWKDNRVAEYILHAHKIRIPHTFAQAEDCSNAMRMSFMLFRLLEELGYRPFSTPKGERSVMEVNSYAAYAVLLECLPFPKTSLEGRLQRQLKLYDLGLEISDPMRIFEEITRYKIIQGILPLEGLYSPYELEAMVAAYTAWLAIEHPERVSVLGDPREGQIVLPAKVLKSEYR